MVLAILDSLKIWLCPLFWEFSEAYVGSVIMFALKACIASVYGAMVGLSLVLLNISSRIHSIVLE